MYSYSVLRFVGYVLTIFIVIPLLSESGLSSAALNEFYHGFLLVHNSIRGGSWRGSCDLQDTVDGSYQFSSQMGFCWGNSKRFLNGTIQSKPEFRKESIPLVMLFPRHTMPAWLSECDSLFLCVTTA